MKTVKVISMSEVKSENRTADKKVNRQYYVTEFADPANPFAKTVRRTFWQQHNADGTSAEWKGANPSITKSFLNKEIPGSFVNAKVETYDVLLADGTQQKRKDGSKVTADNVTVVLFEGENLATIVKSVGKILLTEESAKAPKVEEKSPLVV